MWPAIGAIGGALVGGLLSKAGQESANEANIGISRDQMAFQERMSSTAYQRATADMSAAGLNPMLAYQQGGASSPTGSTTTVQNPNAQLGANVSSAASTVAQLENVKAQTDRTRAEERNIEADTELKGVQVPKVQADTQVSQRTVDLVEKQAANVAQQTSNLVVAREVLQNNVPKSEYEAIQAKYETLLKISDFKQMRPEQVKRLAAEAKLLELDIPKALNEALMEDTGFKKYISPFLKDVGSITNSAARTRYLGSGLRR